MEGKKKRRALPVLALALGLVVAGVFFYRYQGEESAFREERTANAARINELTQRLAALEGAAAGSEGADYSAMLMSAAEAGRIVAEAQNRYIAGDYVPGGEGDPLDLMGDLIGDGTKKSRWGRIGKDLDGTPCRWEFNTIYEFGLERIPVVWTCWAGEDLLSAMTAVYHAGAGQFTDFRLYEMEASKGTLANEDTTPEPDVCIPDYAKEG